MVIKILIKFRIIDANKLVSILTSIFNVIIFYSKLHFLSTNFTHLSWFATLNRKTGRGRWARWPCFKTWYWHIILAWVAQTQLALIRLHKCFQILIHNKIFTLNIFHWKAFGATSLVTERLSNAFMANGKHEFVPREPVSLLLGIYRSL